MFRGSVKGTGYPLHSPVSPSLPLPRVTVCYHISTGLYYGHNTGLFISPSGISELDCPTTKTDTAERSISIGRETLQVFFFTTGLGVLPVSTDRG